MIEGEGLGPSVDLHSHLVPGVDDGAGSVDDALEGLKRMHATGISVVVTTPHLEGSVTLLPERFKVRVEEFDEAFQRLLVRMEDELPGIEISRANEVALDHPEPDLTAPSLRLGEGQYVLVEWPRLRVPSSSTRVLQRLSEQNVGLLLAHPERYRLGDGAMERMAEWKEAGACFQVNYGSLVGAYGPDARRRGLELLARGWVDCLATDFHGRPALRLFISEAMEGILDRGEEREDSVEVWRLLSRTNPERIFRGEVPAPVRPLGRGEGIWQRLTSLFR